MSFDPAHQQSIDDQIKALQAAFQAALIAHPENLVALQAQLRADIATALAS